MSSGVNFLMDKLSFDNKNELCKLFDSMAKSTNKKSTLEIIIVENHRNKNIDQGKLNAIIDMIDKKHFLTIILVGYSSIMMLPPTSMEHITKIQRYINRHRLSPSDSLLCDINKLKDQINSKTSPFIEINNWNYPIVIKEAN